MSNTIEKTAEAAVIAGAFVLPIADAVFETVEQFAVREFHRRNRLRHAIR
jgi:hypothetical protein